MLIHPGTQERLIAETTVGAGSTSKEGSIQSDSLLATLWVNSVTSGSLSVTVYTLTDNGKEVELFSITTIVAPSTELLLKKSGVSLQRFRVAVTYTGICNYEIYIRAVEGAGESNARILGAGQWSVEQESISPVASVLIPAALVDRNGVVVKNWGGTGNLYLAETLAKATSAIGWPLAPKDAIAMDIVAGAEIYAVSDSGIIDVRIAQAGS